MRILPEWQTRLAELYSPEFIDAINQDCVWLVQHDIIQYKTDIMVTTSSTSNSVIKISLLECFPSTSRFNFNTNYYDVIEATPITDHLGSLTFKLKCKFNTPAGVTVTVLPLKPYDKVNMLQAKNEVDYIKESPIYQKLLKERDELLHKIKYVQTEIAYNQMKYNKLDKKLSKIENNYSDTMIKLDSTLSKFKELLEDNKNGHIPAEARLSDEEVERLRAYINNYKPLSSENKKTTINDDLTLSNSNSNISEEDLNHGRTDSIRSGSGSEQSENQDEESKDQDSGREEATSESQESQNQSSVEGQEGKEER